MQFYIFHNPKLSSKAKEWGERNAQFPSVGEINYNYIDEVEDLRNIKNSLIIIFGGDGTLHLAVNNANIAENLFLLIPRGSGNDFFANLANDQIEFLLNRAMHNTYDEVDVWCCNEVKFISAGSMGFAAKVADLTNNYFKSFGKFKYIIPILRYLLFYKNSSAKYSVVIKDDALRIIPEKPNWLCDFIWGFGNGKFVGGGFKLYYDARINDGLIDFLIIEKTNLFQRIRYFIQVYRGKHSRLNFIKYYQVNSIIFPEKHQHRLELDGEVYLNHSIKITRNVVGLKLVNRIK